MYRVSYQQGISLSLLYKEDNMSTGDVNVCIFRFYSRKTVELEIQAKESLVQTNSL